MDQMKIGLWLAGAVVLGGSHTGAADDWNTGAGGNSARNGLSSEVGPVAADLLWSGSRSAIVAQQAAAEGDIVVMSRISSFTIPTGTWLVAHDLNTGQELWAEQLPYDFPATSWRSRVSAIRDGQVYATRAGNTNADYLYALNAQTGATIWQSEDLVDEGSTESLAFTDNGDIIAGNSDALLRIDSFNGETIWTVSRSCPSSNGCQAAVFGDRVYVFEASPSGPIITAFDVDTGARLYSTPGIGGGFAQQVGPFVGPDGTVYAPRTQNNVVTDFLVAFTDTGTEFAEKWRHEIGYVPFATFGVGPDGSVYSYTAVQNGGNADLTVLRLHPDTGAVVDTSPVIASNYPVQPRMAVDDNGKVFLTNGGFSNGSLSVFAPDLSLIWSTPITNVNVGGPCLAQGGTLVVCGVGTDVRAYRTPCVADWNGDTLLLTNDFVAYLNDYNLVQGGGSPVYGDPDLAEPIGVLNTADLLAYLNLYTTGCP